jgi:hypothetical protein
LINLNGLTANLQSAKGRFRLPAELKECDCVVKVDVMADWLSDMHRSYLNVLGECYLDLCVKPYPNAKFEETLSSFNLAVKRLDLDVPEDIKSFCLEYYKKHIENLKND